MRSKSWFKGYFENIIESEVNGYKGILENPQTWGFWSANSKSTALRLSQCSSWKEKSSSNLYTLNDKWVNSVLGMIQLSFRGQRNLFQGGGGGYCSTVIEINTTDLEILIEQYVKWYSSLFYSNLWPFTVYFPDTKWVG